MEQLNNQPVIDEMMIDYFLNEIKNQCEYVFISENLLKQGIELRDNKIIFYSIHNMFTAFGNISKIVYPKFESPYIERGRTIRAKLDLDETSVFYYDVKLNVPKRYRNKLEHFDEGFQNWYNTDKYKNIIDNNIGPKEMYNIGLQNKFLRHYDPSKNIFTLLNDEYELNSAIDETHQIYTKIKQIEDEKDVFR